MTTILLLRVSPTPGARSLTPREDTCASYGVAVPLRHHPIYPISHYKSIANGRNMQLVQPRFSSGCTVSSGRSDKRGTHVYPPELWNCLGHQSPLTPTQASCLCLLLSTLQPRKVHVSLSLTGHQARWGGHHSLERLQRGGNHNNQSASATALSTQQVALSTRHSALSK